MTYLARTMRSLSTDSEGEHSSAIFPVGLGSLHYPSTTSVEGLRMAQDFSHTPVLLEEVTALFEPVPAGVIVDATLGGAGHAAALLSRRIDLGVLGIDRDPSARAAAQAVLAPFGGRAVVVAGRFGEIRRIVEDGLAGGSWPVLPGPGTPAPLVGILADLGVSSPQLDRGERGFSFSRPGPLDMRMDPTRGETASQLLDRLDLDALTQLLREHGETRHARRIARALLAARPITTTTQLVEVVDAAVPRADRRRGNVASRAFQALRVAVNDELEELADLLDASIELLAPGGRLVVLSYHSGEDGLVKHTMRAWADGGCTCPPGMPCVCGAMPKGRLVGRRAGRAGEDEAERNPRSTSARLRCFEVGP
jgi:16S rRNA (cytosine1402-N4)-methyltransferase